MESPESCPGHKGWAATCCVYPGCNSWRCHACKAEGAHKHGVEFKVDQADEQLCEDCAKREAENIERGGTSEYVTKLKDPCDDCQDRVGSAELYTCTTCKDRVVCWPCAALLARREAAGLDKLTPPPKGGSHEVVCGSCLGTMAAALKSNGKDQATAPQPNAEAESSDGNNGTVEAGRTGEDKDPVHDAETGSNAGDEALAQQPKDNLVPKWIILSRVKPFCCPPRVLLTCPWDVPFGPLCHFNANGFWKCPLTNNLAELNLI